MGKVDVAVIACVVNFQMHVVQGFLKRDLQKSALEVSIGSDVRAGGALIFGHL